MNYGMDYQGAGGGFGGGGGGFGGGGGGGGGFNQPQSQPTPFRGGGGGQQAPGSGGRARRSYDEVSLTPVTIRMLLACRPEKNDTSTGNMELEDGRVLSNVKLVAAVRSFEESSTNVLYTVEDGTGLFEVKQWVDDSSCTALTEIRQPTLHENVYVKVIGHVKAYDGRAVLVANSVRRVGTSNELAHHLLEAVYVGERHKRKASSSAASGMGGAGSVGSGVGFGGAAARPFLGPPSGAPLAAHGSAGQGGGGRSLADAVLAWVRDRSRDDPNTGANMPDCIRELAGRGGHAEHEIRRAFADLTDEGHIYSTFDENHYTCV